MREPGWGVRLDGRPDIRGCTVSQSTDDTRVSHTTPGAGGRSRAARHDPALRLILRRRNPASACYKHHSPRKKH